MDPENRGNNTIIHDDDFKESGAIIPLSQRDALIVEMYEDGLSTYEISEQLDINRHTISRVLKENEKPEQLLIITSLNMMILSCYSKKEKANTR